MRSPAANVTRATWLPAGSCCQRSLHCCSTRSAYVSIFALACGAGRRRTVCGPSAAGRPYRSGCGVGGVGARRGPYRGSVSRVFPRAGVSTTCRCKSPRRSPRGSWHALGSSGALFALLWLARSRRVHDQDCSNGTCVCVAGGNCDPGCAAPPCHVGRTRRQVDVQRERDLRQRHVHLAEEQRRLRVLGGALPTSCAAGSTCVVTRPAGTGGDGGLRHRVRRRRSDPWRARMEPRRRATRRVRGLDETTLEDCGPALGLAGA